MRRYPHPVFSRVRRITSARIDRIVGGRTGRRGRERRACRRAIRSRCQRNTVSGGHQQPQMVQHAARQRVQQGCQPGPVGWTGLHPVAVQLPLQDHDLMPQREDLGVPIPVTHRQQPQQGQGVGHTEVGQSQQHNRSSSRSAPQRSPPRSGRWNPPRAPAARVGD
jgi:hypothetical protein